MSKTYYPGKEPLIHVYGRTNMQNPLPLFWSASGIEFRTNASECELELTADYSDYEQWIRIELNEYQLIRMPLVRGKNVISVFRGMTESGEKKVRLYKEVQAMGDPKAKLTVDKVICNGELLPLADFECRIEFVGDSITSGEGLAGNSTMQDWVASVFSNVGHYAVETATNLHADYRIVSQSGWGTYCGYNNDITMTIPGIYDQICGVQAEGIGAELGSMKENDFENWQPDIVVINLGTNDEGAFHFEEWKNPHTGEIYKQKLNEDESYEQESVNRLEASVYAFLSKLRNRNPKAHLLWVYGMMGTGLSIYLEETIARYKNDTGDQNVSYQLLPDTLPEWLGARMHPGIPSHHATAEVLTAAIQNILKN